MLLTHTLNGQSRLKSQTPKRKIKQIATSKNSLNPYSKNTCSYKKLGENKQNENPNIKKSPSQQKQGIQIQNNKNKEVRVKSQCNNPPGMPITKQSPIKKILFVKNMNYKSNKTSKNSSLQKRQESIPPTKYLDLNNYHKNINQNFQQSQNVRYRKDQKYFSTSNLLQNESEIYSKNMVNDKKLQQFKPRQTKQYQNDHQANYKFSVLQNQCLPKSNPIIQRKSTTNISHKMNNYQPSSSNTTYYSNKYNRLCPNIESADILQLQSFKNKNYLLPTKTQPKILISGQKQKKQSLSIMKRNSRVKIIQKQPENESQSFNEQLFTSKSQNSNFFNSPEYNLKIKSQKFGSQTQTFRNSESESFFKNQQSTLHQTTKSKNLQDTFQNLSSQFLSIGSVDIKQQKFHQNHVNLNSKHYCINHSQKLAKYKINKNIQKPFYCQKCTVSLVTQGYKIIENLNEKICRLQILKNFTFNIDVLQPKFKITQQNVTELQRSLRLTFENSRQQIIKYYKKLQQVLFHQKQETLKSLNYHFQNPYSQIRQLKRRHKQNIQEITFIKGDIIPNVNLIIDQSQICDQSFKKIIFQHQNKLNTLDKQIKYIQNLFQGKDNKIVIKQVQISSIQLKNALNMLERTQIVFKQKILRHISYEKNTNQLRKRENSRKNKSLQTLGEDTTQKSISFDEENLQTSFYIPSSKKKNFNGNILQNQNLYQLSDSIRLSFGNKLQNKNSSSIKSPTFKVI